MAHRLPARARRPGQLPRPDQPLGLARCAARLVRAVVGCVRVSLDRLQLDLRSRPDTGRRAVGPMGRSTRRTRKRAALEYRHVRRRSCPRLVLVFRSADAAGCGRSVHLSGERQSARLLVPARRARARHGGHGRRGKVLERRRGTAHRGPDPECRLALELCGDRLDQSRVSRLVHARLPQSQRGRGTLESGTGVSCSLAAHRGKISSGHRGALRWAIS